MTESIRHRGYSLEELRGIIEKKTNRNLSIYELNNLLIRFGMDNIEDLTDQIDKQQNNTIPGKDKQEIIDKMNEIPDDELFKEEDAVEIGRMINNGIVRRYLEDTRKGD